MIPYALQAFISITILSLIHLLAFQTYHIRRKERTRFLSAASGISVAYVFVELLPKLGQGQKTVQESVIGVLPFFELHVYLMAFLGFLFYYGIETSTVAADKSQNNGNGTLSFWISMSAYIIFNFLVGQAVVDINDPDVQPLALFTIAMGLHYIVNDHALREKHLQPYHDIGRWVLVTALLLGFLTGYYFELSEAFIAVVVAFIAGGVVLNVLRYELPANRPHSFISFALGGLIYAFIIAFKPGS